MPPRFDKNNLFLLAIFFLLAALAVWYVLEDPGHLLVFVVAGLLAYIFWHRRAKAEIFRQKTLFKGVFNCSPEAMVLTDRDRKILLCNPGTAQTFGYSAAELVGACATTFYAEERDFLRVAELYSSAGSGEEVCPVAVTFRHKDGHNFPGEVSGAIIRNAAGEFLCFMAMLRDVSERVAAEQALQESERRFCELISQLPQPVLEMDLAGRITFANHNAFQYFMYKHEDFANGFAAVDTITEGDRKRAVSDYKKILAGELLPPVEYRMYRDDGVEFPAMIYFTPVIRAGAATGVRSLVFDITELRQADEALRLSEQTLRAVFNSVYDAIILHGQDGRILDANDKTLAIFGVSVEQARELSFCKDLSSDPQKAEILSGFWKKAMDGEPQLFEWDCRRPGDGSVFFAEIFLRKIPTKNGQVLIANIRDISERKESETRLRDNHRRLNYLAYHDTLTSLPNLLMLHDRLQSAMAKARRSNCQVALLVLDLDRFKNINDALGHGFGDRLLVEMANRLLECVRDCDTVARQGGDEFIIILDEIYNLRQVVQVAEKILNALAEPILLDAHRLYVTSSIGISMFPSASTSSEGLIKCADVAMYRAKDEGRNTFQFYAPEMNARAQEFLLLESNLRQALEQDQLLLYYQPQFDMVGRELIGVEALVRWLHPEQGLIPPDDFIPLAEETGLIVPIGEWVLRTACEQTVHWQEQGFAPVRMAVNISARQFKQPDLVAMIDRALSDSGLAPEYLELELTESLVVEHGGDTLVMMTELRDRGISLAIDDFGTGYSSLSYLKNLPISKLKIDRSFLRDINVSSDDASIAAAVIALAHSLNLSVLAEGVESEEQIAFLLEKGCIEGQGYYFSRPRPAAEVESFLKKK